MEAYTKKEIEELFTPENYAIVCREYSKFSPEMAVYEVKVDKFTDNMFSMIKLRSRFNPELTYYVTKRENLQTVINVLSADSEFAIPNEDKSLMVKIS